MGKTARIMKYGFIAPLALIGCAMESGEEPTTGTTEQAAITDSFSNPTGRHRNVTVDGSTPQEAGNPFFTPIGGTNNGRACVHCHQPSAAMTITPSQVQAVFNATQGLDPVFRKFDGSNGPNIADATVDQRRRGYSLLLNKALIRIPFNLPANRDYDVRLVLDPYAGTGAQSVAQNQNIPSGGAMSFYRRPMLSANTRFISAVMWDGREAAVGTDSLGTPASSPNSAVFRNMMVQSNNATRGHAESSQDITTAQRDAIVRFQMNLVVAQESDNQAGTLPGGPQQLRSQQSWFGINDSHGNIFPPGTAFNRNVMTMFNAWAGNSNARRASIARGQNLFNTRLIRISGVRGVNDALGVATLNGACTTCHTHPNVGNHTDILPLDLGLIKPGEGDNVLPVFRVTERATGRAEEVTDLGRAVLTGRFADLGKMKGPTLRGLSARAPYFHHGAADNLTEVIQFYDRRFGMGLQAQEIADLRAFLECL